MRVANRNKRELMYSVKQSSQPVYERNADGSIKYITVDGTQVAVETGEKKDAYSVPKTFHANISMSGGEVVPVEYGLDYSTYDAVIVTELNYIPIKEGDLIWFTSIPTYEDEGHTIVNPHSADFRVMRVNESINSVRYLLSQVVE